MEGRRIWVAGHRGMVGSAVVRRLAREDCEVLTVDRDKVDLRRQAEVESWMRASRPDVVILAAARVGGIHANTSRPADFLDDNLALQTNNIHTAAEIGVRKLLFLGSSCIYPRLAPQPIPESALLTGPLEPTNQWYAIAKIAGLMQCQAYREQYGCDFISAMPTNLYGPGDNFDLEGAHVLPALLRRFRAATLGGDTPITIWGTGTPRREFLHVDDCADALVFLMKTYSGESQINVGSGEDLTIRELTELVCEVVGFKGEIVNDTTIPDGMPRKLMSARRLRSMGWSPRIALKEGIREEYAWFLANVVAPA
ncbi:MAG: GDP-L-fucose synthase [Alphaproteobacteria bacterium]|nr:GDP-L-fucose synthase [Alphaproteobacteria bacterium]